MADRFSDQFIAFMQMAPKQRKTAWWRGRILQCMGVLVAWFWLGLMLYLLHPIEFTPAPPPYQPLFHGL
jgi:hypothetical protein